jgi:hypothetical protein
MESLKDIFKRIELAQQDIANISNKINAKGEKLDDYDIKNILFVARELYENAVLLSNYKSIEKNIIDAYTTTKSPAVEVVVETPKITQPIVEQVVDEVKVIEFSKEEIKEITPISTIEIENKQPVFEETKIEEITLEEIKEPENIIVIEETTKIIEDTKNIEEIAQNLEVEITQTIQSFTAQTTVTSSANKSIFEKIADEKSADNSLASKLSKTKIKDLVNSIGLNEKFLFINELFDGNSALYNQEIQVLNTQNNSSEALQYFQELQQKNNWEKESKVYEKLKDLVERRYI